MVYLLASDHCANCHTEMEYEVQHIILRLAKESSHTHQANKTQPSSFTYTTQWHVKQQKIKLTTT